MAEVWLKPDAFPDLCDDDVHVWRMPLVTGDYRRLLPLLAPDEVRRARQFLFEKHREHFVVGRARMRQLLGAYVACAAQDVEFAYENLGKPIFKSPQLHRRIRFNFSNSNDCGLLAVTIGGQIGIDLERVRPMNDMPGLARRYYAETETRKLFALPEPEQPNAFFRCWTRKEAYLKAVGKGLTFPLRDVEVSLLATEPCQILNIHSESDEASDWSLHHLNPFPGYFGALAIRRKIKPPRMWDWTQEVIS